MPTNLVWTSITPIEGINLTQTYAAPYSQSSVTSATNDPSNPSDGTVQLGSIVFANNDSAWVLLQASTTITAYNCVAFDANFKANNITSALAIANPMGIGVPQFSTGVTDPGVNPYFWAAIKGGGGMLVNVSGSAGTGVVVNTGTQAGYLTVSTTGTTIRSLLFNTSTGASGTTDIVMQWPHTAALG